MHENIICHVRALSARTRLPIIILKYIILLCMGLTRLVKTKKQKERDKIKKKKNSGSNLNNYRAVPIVAQHFRVCMHTVVRGLSVFLNI